MSQVTDARRVSCSRPPGVVTVAVGRFAPLVCHGLLALLGEDSDLRVIAVDIEHAALERTVAQHAPAVVIVNQGVDRSLVARLRAIQPASGLLVLAREPTRAYGIWLLAFGATCLDHEAGLENILAAVHLTGNGGRVFMAADGHRVERSSPGAAPLLTERETEVLEQLSKWRSYAAIGLELGIAVETVRKHAASIRRKLDATCLKDLVGVPPTHSQR